MNTTINPKKLINSNYYKEFSNLNPIKLVDIGSREGLPEELNQISDSIMVIGFEPDKKECEVLNNNTNKNHIYYPFPLYNKSANIDFIMTKKLACSSILKPNKKYLDRFPNSHLYGIDNVIKMQCNTLDNILKEHKHHDIDLIKLDTQGSELPILQGAIDCLQNSIFCVEVEVEFSPQYENQHFFSDVDQYLRKLGFSLFDIKLVRLKRKNSKKIFSKGSLTWGNAVYFKDFLEIKKGHD